MKLKSSAPMTFSTLRVFAIFSVAFFVLLMLLSTFVVIPKINQLFESQHEQKIIVELAQKSAIFINFVQSQRNFVDDLARYPSLTNAVMLSDSGSIPMQALLDNVVIGGEKGRLVLQDIAANVLAKTVNDLQADYGEQQLWIEQLLSGVKAYDFELLGQREQIITFRMSVPIYYNGYIEGILSAEIKASLNDVLIIESGVLKVAVKLTQNSLTVGTSAEQIELAREDINKLTELDIILTYVTDDAPILEDKRKLKNLIFSVLFVSLVLSFFVLVVLGYSGLSQRARVVDSNRVWQVFFMPMLVGVIGVGASIVAYMVVLNLKQASIEKSFIFDSQQKIQIVKDKLNGYLNTLDAVKAFFDASENVNRQEFKTFALPLLKNHKGVQALEWIPYVSHAQRNDYERQAKLNGIEDFSFKENGGKGVLVAAKIRDDYYPVYYAEPLEGNENVIGFDFGSNNERLAALIKARDSGNRVATSRVSLVQGDNSQIGVLLINPVYDEVDNKEQFSQQQNLVGFIALVLRVEELIAQVLSKEEYNLSMFIEDISDPENSEVIYGNNQYAGLFSRNEVIDIAGRSWRINTYSKVVKSNFNWTALMVMIGGLLFTGLITVGLIHLISRREVVEQLVRSRTAELSESEEQHRAVVENAADGLLTINEYGVIEKFNNAAQSIFGYTTKEVVGMDIKVLMPEPYRQIDEDDNENDNDLNINQIIGVGRYVEGKRKDGSLFPIELSFSELNLANDVKFSGIVRDISERIRSENEKEKFIEKLTDSNEELERFAYVCSHDLQEPLRMISSFSEKLQTHLVKTLEGDERGTKYFNFVIDGAIRAQALITDILAYSSISNDTQKLVDVDVEDLITVISNNILNSTDDKSGKITFDALPQLRGNKTQLLQLFQNLINNGMKYQAAGAAAHVHVSVKELDEHWQFSIKDNGIGMEERHLKKIFDVFQRLHRRTQYSGTGVGLSICKKVAGRHGGSIWVESEKGTGSTFHVKLAKSTVVEED